MYNNAVDVHVITTFNEIRYSGLHALSIDSLADSVCVLLL